MKVYTKTGDEGTTSKYDGERVPKDHPVIILGHKIDCLLGGIDSALILIKNEEIRLILEQIQAKLWQTAGEISLGMKGKKVENEITEQDISDMEANIDKYNQKISFFTRFKTEQAVRLNEARLRCRELEIELTPLLREKKIRPEVYKYINRLSDLLYVLACFEQKN